MCVYVGFYIPLQWVHHLWLLFVLPPHQDWPNKVQYLQTQCVCCFHLIDPEYLRHLVHMKWAWLAPVLLLGQIINIYCLKTKRGEQFPFLWPVTWWTLGISRPDRLWGEASEWHQKELIAQLTVKISSSLANLLASRLSRTTRNAMTSEKF